MYKNCISIIGIIFLLAGLSTESTALDPGKALTQYMIDCWDDESGLPQNFVRVVHQTSDGYVWAGTEEGLARFDGVYFTIFNESNTPALSSNYIYCLFEDSRRNLWIGTVGSGLLTYQNGTFKRYDKNDGFDADVVQCIAEDHDKNLWIGTDGKGVFRFDGSSFTHYSGDGENEVPHKIIRSLYVDHNGNLWIGSAKGLTVLKNNKLQFYTEEQGGLPQTVINTIAQDHEAHIWVGTDTGLYHLAADSFIKVETGIAQEKYKIYTLYTDSHGIMWAGTEKDGLIRCEKDGYSVINKSGGLPDNLVLSIKEDNEGSLWLGTAYAGLVRLKNGKFTTISTREGLSNDIVFAVFQDSKDYLWIGTNNGLNRLKNGKFLHITTKDGLTNNGISAIFEDSRGHIWVGTDNGLNQLLSTPARVYKRSHYALDNYVLTVEGDKNNTIWAGSLRGIYKVKPNHPEPEELDTENGLASNVINCIFKDSKANLWISTLRAGLTKYKDGRLTLYTIKDGLVGNSFYCIFEDSEAVLWFGSSSGLTRLKDGKFDSFTKKHGLFNNNIYKILEDGNGNLWFSGNKGIFRIAKKELDEVAAGKRERVNSTVYGKSDGMPTNECNGGMQSAGCRSSDGKLWFPTTKGVVWIDPENIVTNNVKPPVFIEKVLLDGTETDTSEGITVPPGVKRMEIHFTALSYVDPKKVFFKYKLEGYDEEWVGSGTQRTAWYTNLDGGNYTFRVIACNNDGLWNIQGASIALEVIPPIWRTWWFTLLALLAFAFLSYGIIHFLSRYIAMASFWKRKKYVGSFKLLDRIGSGGMGTVYKASSLRDKTETVAVKILREEMFEDQSNIKRFKQEGAIIDQLDHPNIIKVVERGMSGDYYFIAMEYLQGRTLSKKIEEDKQIDLKEGVHIMRQVVSAMKKIHSKNIIHRDMKPDNVMLVQKGSDRNYVKLLDFGLAKTQYQTRLTQTGIVIGTVNYLSPEQISGKGSFPASDIYAMGVMFYEMMTGEKPYRGTTTVDIMKQILDKSPIEPVRFRSDMSLDLNHLIMRMMDKDKEKRPGVASVLDELTVISSNLVDPANRL